jgi:hypothetical protein
VAPETALMSSAVLTLRVSCLSFAIAGGLIVALLLVTG